jgi:hypothetical protein
VRLLHELAKISATFDDPHLVSQAGLVPVMALAQRTGPGAPGGRVEVPGAGDAGAAVCLGGGGPGDAQPATWARRASRCPVSVQ